MQVRNFIVLLLLPYVATAENGVGSGVGFSSPPVLVSEEEMELPLPVLIKRMVDGTVSTDLSIDRTGRVVRCRIAASVDPLLDSLVCDAMKRSHFSPAYSDGQAVPSTVTMDFTFDLKAVTRNSSGAPPEISGVLLEKGTGIPVANAKVNLQPADTAVSDIPNINRYMSLIALLPDQHYANGILSTTTDSAGNFAFRLLPAGLMRCAFIRKGYGIAHAELQVREGVSQKITCRMEPLVRDTVYEMVVYGKPVHQGRIDIEEEAVKSGLTHFLSELMQMKTVIRNIPESKTVFMVRGGSPFDNRYYISGIPFLSPFHFGGIPALEIDGLMINSLNEITMTVDDICGRQLDASGFKLDANPGIYRNVNRKKIPSTELSVDYSTIGQDLLLSIPRKRSTGLYQLGFTHGEKYTLRSFNFRRDYYRPSQFPPNDYGNATFTFSDSVFGTHINSFSWFAWDCYGWNNEIKKPWGMASISLKPSGAWLSEILLGGSSQYLTFNNDLGIYKSLNYCRLYSGNVMVASDTFSTPFAYITGSATVEGTRWEGFGHYSREPFGTNGNVQKKHITSGGDELSLSTQWSFSRMVGPVNLGANVLGSVIGYKDTITLAGDAGIYAKWQGTSFSAGLYCGRVTSRPDIRGQPQALFRAKTFSSYLLSLPLSFTNDKSVYIGIQPYLRCKPNEPALDPILYRWDEHSGTALFAAGCDFNMDYQLVSWMSLNSSVNLMHSRRIKDESTQPYEWDIPWTVRSGVHLWGGTGSKLHLYINGFLSEGMYYYDLVEEHYRRLPRFLKNDFSVQYRSKIYDVRFLTRYDGYFRFSNFLDHTNITGYTWQNGMTPFPVFASDVLFEIGARVGFRL